MKLRWLIPLAILLPLRLNAFGPVVAGKITTIVVNPNEVTPLHLRPDFVSTIQLPEEVTSVDLGSRGSFSAEHNEGEPEYVYVKPITKEPAQSNLEIAMKSGQHVTLELISEGTAGNGSVQPVDFLIQYRSTKGFLVGSDESMPSRTDVTGLNNRLTKRNSSAVIAPPVSTSSSLSALDLEFQQQIRLNSPNWTKWEGKQIETSIGDVRQWSNETVISYSILNPSDRAVEIVPPQIQITGRKVEKKKKKQGKGIISDQLQIRDFKLSTTRLEPGSRADGVVVFDRPNFKESTEMLFLQIAQADQVDKPILIRLPFTPPIATDNR
jgi:hypothetical protein